jgi:putative glycerol-1-phosphate prenyltransferase
MLLAILLDPDKIVWNTLDSLISKINQSPATHILAGSLCFYTTILITKIKQSISHQLYFSETHLKFQIKQMQFFLSLISGRNPII